MTSEQIQKDRYSKSKKAFQSGRFDSCIDDFLSLSKSGDARATFYAAVIFEKGGGKVGRDMVRARKLYKMSLDQSFSPAAALSLAIMLYQGRGGDKDYPQAFKYFEMYQDIAFPLIMLGTMKYHGQGCIKDEAGALSMFDEAWRLGHPIGLKEASILRFHRGSYFSAAIGFVYSVMLIFWYYGIRKCPYVRTPKEMRVENSPFLA